jgi:lysophospholipase L1-like esterase
LWLRGTRGRLILCIGDSITAGFGSTDRSRDAYPMVLDGLLPNDTVNSYFLGGSSATRGTPRPFYGSMAHQLALATKPDAVLIMLGTNDSKDRVWQLARFERDLEALAAGFARLPSRPKVLLLAPPPLYAAPYDFRPEAINYEVPLALPAVAKRVRNASASLRVFEALGGRGLACPECFFGDPRYTNDGVHPTDYGYHRIADGACAALEDGLGVACAPHAFPRPRPASNAHRAAPAALAALAAALVARELAS